MMREPKKKKQKTLYRIFCFMFVCLRCVVCLQVLRRAV